MKNRRIGIDLGRKLKKLESFQLPKPSDLRPLGPFTQTGQSPDFAETAAMEVGRRTNRKKIQGRRFNR